MEPLIKSQHALLLDQHFSSNKFVIIRKLQFVIIRKLQFVIIRKLQNQWELKSHWN